MEQEPKTPAPEPNVDQAKKDAEDAEKRADDALDSVDKLGEEAPTPAPATVDQKPTWAGKPKETDEKES